MENNKNILLRLRKKHGKRFSNGNSKNALAVLRAKNCKNDRFG